MTLSQLQPDPWARLLEPFVQHAPGIAAAGLLLGLVVLLLGAKLLRAAVLFAGAFAAGALGYLLAPSIFTVPSFGGMSVSAIAAALGAIAGLALASLLYRTAAIAASAAAFAALGILIASVSFTIIKHDRVLPPGTTSSAAQAWVNTASAAFTPTTLDHPPTPAEQLTHASHTALVATGQTLLSLWQAATPDARLYLAAGALGGLLLGLVLAALSAAKAMALTTSLAGAALCLASLMLLAPHVGLDLNSPNADRAALCTFGALVSLGSFVQLRSLKKPKRPAPPPAPAA